MTIPIGQIEARRRRRFAVLSRATLGNAISATEGLAAALMSLILCIDHLPLLVLSVGATSGIVYGAIATTAVRRFLAYADLRHPYALHAVLSWWVAAAAGLLVGLAVTRWDLAWGHTFWAWLMVTPLILLGLRVAFFQTLAGMLARGQLQVERIGVIGDGEAVARLRNDPRIWQQGGQVVTSLVLPNDLTDILPAPGVIADFARSCVEKRCQHLLLVSNLQDLDAIEAVVGPCRPYSLNVLLYPHELERSGRIGLVDIVPLGSGKTLRLLGTPLNDTGRLLKRGLDVLGAGLGLVLLVPLLLGVALAIRLTSPGPALFQQERRGFNGDNFRILKFRSMRVMENGRAMHQAQVNDPRVTPVGRFIRRTSIDELPQLINVLRGEMSLVGPRPHAISHDDELSSKFELYAQRQRIKPGITGWAQVNGYRGDTSTEAKIEGRTLHDLYYVENWSLLLDCWVLLLTVFSRRARENAL